MLQEIQVGFLVSHDKLHRFNEKVIFGLRRGRTWNLAGHAETKIDGQYPLSTVIKATQVPPYCNNSKQSEASVTIATLPSKGTVIHASC